MGRGRVFFGMEIDLMVGGTMMKFKVKVHMFSSMGMSTKGR